MKLPERIKLIHAPTPIESLPLLSQELGVNLFVKRDDRTGFEWSGNKVRKLEFLFAEAKAKGANTVVTCGGVQSNHCRATAAIAAKLGMRCILLLRGEEPEKYNANFLLDRIFGAETFFLSADAYYNEMAEIYRNLESQIRQTGGRSYFIPEGGSNALGSLGYVSCWDEIIEQVMEVNSPIKEGFDAVYVAHGSGGTLAGLTLGKILREAAPESLKQAKIIGVNVCYEKAKSFSLVKDILWKSIQGFNLGKSFFADDFEILEGFLGQGYAKFTAEELKFYLHVARSEGILLDPTYTGKAFRGMVESLRGSVGKFKNVLFIHTGGSFANFGAANEWQNILKS